MKANYKIAVALLGSFGLGLDAAGVLNAQARPPAYVLAEVDVKDQDGYNKEFLPKAKANIKEFGGKYLGGGYNKALGLTGAPPHNRVVLFEFPDMESLRAFYHKDRAPEAGRRQQICQLSGDGDPRRRTEVK